MPNHKPGFPLPLVIFSLLYLAAASVSAMIHGNREFAFYIVVMVVLITAVYLVHRRCNLSPALLWCFSIWGLLHMAGGLVEIPKSWPFNGPNNVLYSMWLIPEKLKYDQVVHAYGFGITTWLCWEALRSGLEPRYGMRLVPSGGLMVLCAAGGMGFGAFNEIVEFIATLTIPSTNVGGYLNTGWDLVFNAIGSTGAALVIYFRGRRGNARRYQAA